MAVVDGKLKVYGVNRLRIADASIMPRISTGNTQAPCVVIGERAADILRTEHNLPAAPSVIPERLCAQRNLATCSSPTVAVPTKS